MTKETKRKIFNLYEDSQNLNIKTNNLLNIEKRNITASFLENKNEIILLEEQLVELPNYTIYDYSFEDLNDEDIRFIRPVMILTTSDGFEFDQTFFFYTFYSFWQKLDERYKLIFRTRAFIIDPVTSTTDAIPIYLNLKLIVYNDRVYKTIQQMRQ